MSARGPRKQILTGSSGLAITDGFQRRSFISLSNVRQRQAAAAESTFNYSGNNVTEAMKACDAMFLSVRCAVTVPHVEVTRRKALSRTSWWLLSVLISARNAANVFHEIRPRTNNPPNSILAARFLLDEPASNQIIRGRYSRPACGEIRSEVFRNPRVLGFAGQVCPSISA